jgi:hypothetical protein
VDHSHNGHNSTQDHHNILHGLVVEENEYDALRIPCDWELAQKHALARRTGPELKDEDMHAKRTNV